MFQSKDHFVRFTIVLAFLATAGSVFSQAEPLTIDEGLQAGSEAEPPEENPSDWQYQASISLPTEDWGSFVDPTLDSNLMDLFVTAEVLGGSRHDLSDLRLDAADGSSISFAVRTLAARTVKEEMQFSTFNQSQTNSGTQEITLELTGTLATHNQVSVETSGSEFRRLIVVEGSDDGHDWRKLTRGFIWKFLEDDQPVSRSTLRYPESRHRFLRVQVEPDPQLTSQESTSDRFEISSVLVLKQFAIPAMLVSTDAVVGPREPTRQYGSPGSRWIIDFGAEIPVERLEVVIEDAEFARDVSLEAETVNMLGQPEFYAVYPNESSTWQRQKGDAMSDLALTFAEVRTRRMRITVTDYRNKPLTMTAAKGVASARQIVFPRLDAIQFPLTLRYGNPEADTPNYDFGRNLPEVLPNTPIRTVLGPAETNPKYLAPPKPFTERYPWFIYVTLGTVSIALGLVVWNLSSAALAQHDTTAKVAQAAKV